jgi:hypothetical protein
MQRPAGCESVITLLRALRRWGLDSGDLATGAPGLGQVFFCVDGAGRPSLRRLLDGTGAAAAARLQVFLGTSSPPGPQQALAAPSRAPCRLDCAAPVRPPSLSPSGDRESDQRSIVMNRRQREVARTVTGRDAKAVMGPPRGAACRVPRLASPGPGRAMPTAGGLRNRWTVAQIQTRLGPATGRRATPVMAVVGARSWPSDPCGRDGAGRVAGIDSPPQPKPPSARRHGQRNRV